MDKSEELNNARIISDEENELDISVISVNDEEDDHVVLYDEKDIEDAKRLGMTVEQLFKMLDECNQYEYDDHEDCVEWPYLGLNEYVDEGAEESMY
jgi:hypothetical protein